MAQSGFKKILVIGDNHEEIIKKYSADTKVEKYIYMKRDDAEKNQRKYLKYLETLLNNKEIKLPEYQREVYQDLYMDIKEMDERKVKEHSPIRFICWTEAYHIQQRKRILIGAWNICTILIYMKQLGIL